MTQSIHPDEVRATAAGAVQHVRPAALWLLALLAANLLIRAWAPFPDEIVKVPDSGTYVTAARDLISGDFSQGLGRRTPGYPLLVAAAGEDPSAIKLAQMTLGVLTSAFLFAITLLITGRPALGFAVGLLHSLNLQQLFVEGVLASEALSTAMAVFAVTALLLVLRRIRSGRASSAIVVAIGILAAAGILVRPQFLFYGLLLPAFVVYAATGLRWPSRRAIGLAALIAAPMVGAVLAWATVLYVKVGHFTMSTQSGLGLVNHSIFFIEHAPARYAGVRDILLEYRAKRIAEVGHPGNTIWYALPTIREATGWSLPEASREMQRMSAQMFIEHPLRYAVGVASASLEFWTVPAMWMAPSLDRLWWVEHKLLRLGNLAFALIICGVVVSRRFREALRWDLGMTVIAAMILGSCLLQALADRGAGSRYGITSQSLIVLVVIVAAWRAIAHHRSRRVGTAAAAVTPS